MESSKHTNGQGQSAVNVNTELMKLLGVGGKKRNKRKWLFMIGGVLLIGGAAAAYFLWPREQEVNTDVIYREYTVERGDITVGQTESSSVSLTRQVVTFPVSCTVEEVYVRAGSSVKTGDPLVKLNVEDIAASLSSYELQLEMAGLQVEKSKLDQETRLLSAEQTLETSRETGNLASANRDVTIAELTTALSRAQTSLQDAMEELSETTDLSETFTSDYNYLQRLESRVESAKDDVLDLQDDVNSATDYGALRTTAETELKSAWASLNSAALNVDYELAAIAANQSSDTEEEEEDQNKKEEIKAADLADDIGNYYSMNTSSPGVLNTGSGVNYDNAKETIERWENQETGNLTTNLNSMLSALNNMERQAKSVRDYTSQAQGSTSEVQAIQSDLSEAQEAQSYAQDNYDDFKEYFDETYGNIQDAEQLADQILTLEAEVETAQINLNKALLNAETGETSAEQKEETARTGARTAAASYELTEIELQQTVDAAQEAYDDLEVQIAEAKELITEDGILYSSYNGMVASVQVDAGDEITVTLDKETMRIGQYAQLMVMTDITNVYVPITISEEDILSVSIGQTAQVTMTAFPDRTFDAVVDTISVESSRAGAATISYAVTVRFAQVNALDMYEGMSATVTLVQRSAANVLYVANQAIRNVDGVATVLVRGDDGAPVEKVVQTGFSDGRFVEILSGLSAGDVVLAESAVGRQ